MLGPADSDAAVPHFIYYEPGRYSGTPQEGQGNKTSLFNSSVAVYLLDPRAHELFPLSFGPKALAFLSLYKSICRGWLSQRGSSS